VTKNRDPYIETLGIDQPIEHNGNSEKKLREAYERAHEIRKFEIEMYWTRSTYLWAVQAAALAGLALAASEFEAVSWSCSESAAGDHGNCFGNRFRLILIAAIWAFGAFTAYVWLRILMGAKFWQENWERHVDLLEDHISGALYKTYPINPGRAPYSVSKLNLTMAIFTLCLWLIIGLVSGLTFFWNSGHALLIVAFFLLLYPAERLVDAYIRMDHFPKRPWVAGTTGPWRRKALTFAYRTAREAGHLAVPRNRNGG
jgi:hypothetical protein